MDFKESLHSQTVDMHGQFKYPNFCIGAFARWHGVKVKVNAMRWDDVHREFQYLVCASFTHRNATWVSEVALCLR